MSAHTTEKKSSITVVGADGIVGGTLATALSANRVLHGPGRGLPREIPARDAQSLIADSSVVFNAQGLRQKGSASDAEFRATHVEATRSLIAQMSPGTTLVHISSASVLGRPGPVVGGRAEPDPASFPMPVYASLKLEAERVAIEEGQRRGLSVVVLRPAVVSASPLDGMLLSLVNLLRGGLLLQLLPLRGKHHFCSGELLAATAVAVAGRPWPREKVTIFTVADPFTVTNQELAQALLQRWGGLHGVLPLPAKMAAQVLRPMHGLPKLGDRLSGVVGTLGVVGLDLEYQVDETFAELGLQRSDFGRDRTLDLVLDREAQQDARPQPQHVLVVGATGGVGRVLLEQLASAKKRVSVVGRSAVAGFAGWQKTLDVTHANWADILGGIDARDRVDAVVFVAGTGAFGPASCVPESTGREILELNFWSVTRAATAAAEMWAGQNRCGVFVSVSSLAALRGMPLEAHYAASKAASTRFLQALQFEYPANIRIESIHPGAIATAFRNHVPHFGIKAADTARVGDPPEQTAAAIMALLDGRTGAGPLGKKARAIAALDRLSPSLYDRLTRRRMQTFVRGRRYS